MNRRHVGILALATLLTGLTPLLAFGQDSPSGKEPAHHKEAKALADRIDTIVNGRLQAENVKQGPKATDSAFARRLFIDLIGKIPALTEIRDYLDNDSPDKLDGWLDQMLESPLFVNNWSNYLRSVMLSGSNNIQAQQFQFQFEGWLRDRLAKNTGYDKMAKEVIASEPFTGQQQVSPSVFYFFNENKPENLAGATARVFLGVKIECAQCHKHPFAKWTREQFWEYAAFFSGIQQQIRPKGAPKQEASEPQGRKIMGAECSFTHDAGQLGDVGQEPLFCQSRRRQHLAVFLRRQLDGTDFRAHQ
jgi:hypothetical protein